MRRATLTYHVGLAGVVLAFVSKDMLHPLALLAFAPVIVRALWAWARPPAELHLKRIGILEIFYTLNFLFFSWLALTQAG